MASVEEEIQRARDWNQVLETAWKIPGDVSFFVERLDFTSGTQDPLLIGILESNVDDSIKAVIFRQLSKELFSSATVLRSDRVGNFLNSSIKLFNDTNTPQDVKELIWNTLTPEIMNRVELECNSHRWEMESAEAALHAYTTFLTIDRLFGEENGEIVHRELAYKMIQGRALDEGLNAAATIVQSEDRGAVIYLGARGAEKAQVITQVAHRHTLDEMNATGGVIAPYYRDHALVSADSVSDIDQNYMNFSEAFAELLRVEGATRGAGRELPVKLGINKNGDIRIYPGTANIAGITLAATGFAFSKRAEAIYQNNFIFDQPQRADHARNLQVSSTNEATIISMGDGAIPELDVTLELQRNFRTPVINFIQDNEVAIGVNKREVNGAEMLWKRGHGFEIPGIEINETDTDELYMAIRFSTLRALRDAGSTIIQAKTVRLLPHSSQHGDHLTAGYIQQAKHILEEQLTTTQSSSLLHERVEEFLANKLVRATVSDHQLALKQRLQDFMNTTELDSSTTRKLQDLVQRIIDPYEQTINAWTDRYFSNDERHLWEQNAKQQMEYLTKEMIDAKKRKRPQPETALQYISMSTIRTADLQIEFNKTEVEWNISEAIQHALQEAMQENPRVCLFGTDVYKGLGVKEGEIISLGGYFKQEDGLFDLFGRYPYRVTNTPIAERAMVAFLMGMSTTTTSPEQMAKGWRPIYDPQYADYALEALAAEHVLGSVYYTTEGKVTRPMGILMLQGAAGGGGTMHSHVVEAKVYQTPAGVHIYSVSDPETTYKLLKYCFLYENNPYIIAIDKTMIWRKKKFIIDTGLMEPGHAQILQAGGTLGQFITFGPQTNVIREVRQEIDPQQRFGHIDIFSLRPFPHADLQNFLQNGNGPIIISSQETTGQSFANQILSLFKDEQQYAYRAIVGDRPVHLLCGKDVPAPPCDAILMNAVIPHKSYIITELEKIFK